VSEAPKKKRNIQHEWALQRGIRRFVKRAVAVEHEFACHDRGRARSGAEHIGEANRGIRRSWPDTELAIEGGLTFRCELKRSGIELDADSDQARMLTRLRWLGHPSYWANSVLTYGTWAAAAGVPLAGNWAAIAKHEDERVAADIRGQIVRANKATASPVVKGRVRRKKGQGGRFAASYARLLP
jgi:hypothetical protein